MSFQADVTNTSGSTLTGVTINFGAYEDLGYDRAHYVMRVYCPYETISLLPGEKVHVSSSGAIPQGANVANLHGVVFAQQPNAPNLDVLQAATSTLAVVYEPPSGLFNLGWNWFSLPVIANDPNPDVIFAHDMSNLIYKWDRQGKTILLYPNDFTTLEMGEGYTLYLRNEVYEPSIVGQKAPAIGYINLPAPGWSWIGYPHWGDTPLLDCKVKNLDLGVTRTSTQDANAADPWINWNWLYYSSLERTVKICALTGGGDDDTLHSWYGYRLWSSVKNLQLEIPE
jgi:hypothetical protein